MSRGRKAGHEMPEPATPRPTRLGPRALAATGLALALGLLVAHATWCNFISDDAFIVARYARNVLAGHGWVYNVGERVEGYTSFLWVALTVLLGFVGIDLVTAVRVLSIAGASLGIVVLYVCAPHLGIRRHSLLACLAPLFFACNDIVACWALGGLETCGYAGLIVLALYLAERAATSDRTLPLLLAGIVGGLTGLVRPEGAAVPAILAVALLVRRPRGIGRLLVAFVVPAAAIIGVHLLWRHSYYGDWLPNTYYAKVDHTAAVVARGWRYVLNFVRDTGGLFVWGVPFALAWLPRAGAFARTASVLGLVLTLGVILVGGDGLPMYRFMVPIVPLWALLVAKLIADLSEALYTPRVTAGARAAITSLVVIAVALSVVRVPADSSQYVNYRVQKDVEVPRWRAAGQWLAQHASTDASIACVPIGAIGYYSNLRLYDMLGLTDRHIAHKPVELGHGWAGHEKTDGPYILAQQPTYLLLGNIAVRDQRTPPDSPDFCRPPNTAIRAREQDIFVPRLRQQYRPRIVPLADGLYFHFFELR